MNPAELFAHESNPVRLAPGEILFKAGDAADGMYVLLEGALDVLVGDRVVENSTPGSIIGEMALIDHSPRGATIIAREPCTLAKIDEQRFRRIIQQNPFFATHVMKVLADRIRHMDQLLAQSKHS
ncbi:MAG: family transcriptional regulator, cyclic receptor protein [Verrucomicrobiota bacterium]